MDLVVRIALVSAAGQRWLTELAQVDISLVFENFVPI
jgi:hypothetical protein